MKMNRRAQIGSIALINWRGIGFKIIDMDQRLTALEGSNGAGKTTVMTAFYVALMPDLSMLRVRNVGASEGSQADPGLHGKLGGKGPSYSILDFVNPAGRRVVAGVQLIPKTAPAVDVSKLFVIENLPEDLPLETILTVEKGGESFVPMVTDIQQGVGLHGGETTLFRSVSEYGAHLFREGILPLSMDDKRNRVSFNRLLQASFQGGFSRSLQEKLKDYLLGEDSNTSNIVGRMQENLERCRQTKHLLMNLEEKISTFDKIHGAALEMMSLAFAGIRMQTEEQVHVASANRSRHLEARKKLGSLRLDKERIEKALSEARGELVGSEALLRRAEHTLEQTGKAYEKEEEIAEVGSTIESLRPSRDRADLEHKEICAQEERAAERLAELRKAHTEACERLADAEEAWSRIAREAGLYKSALRRLEEAKEALPDREVAVETADALLSECRSQESKASETRSELESRIQISQENRAAFFEPYDLLAGLTGKKIPFESAYDEAMRLDGEFREAEAFVAMNGDIEKRWGEATARAEARRKLGAELETLFDAGIRISSQAEFSRSGAEVVSELDAAQEGAAGKKEELDRARHQMAELERRRDEVAGRIPAYLDALKFREELSVRFGSGLGSEKEIREKIEALNRELSPARSEETLLRRRHQEMEEEIGTLVNNGGTLDPRLTRLEGALGGKLVASLYEEIDPEEAAEKEARLGPLSEAIMVDDVKAAVEKIETISDLPDELWLVEKGPLDRELFRLKKSGNAIIAEAGGAWRVTQLPRFPKIGLRARRKRIEFLRTEKLALQQEIEGKVSLIETLESGIESLQSLRMKTDLLEGGDPRDAAAELDLRVAELKKDQAGREELLGKARNEIERLSALRGKLQALSATSYLLDEGDLEGAARQLADLKEKVAEASGRIERRKEEIALLRGKINNLRIPPISEEELESLNHAIGALKESWGRWNRAKEAVGQLVESLPHFGYEDSFNHLREQGDLTGALKEEKRALAEEMEKVTELSAELSRAKAASWEVFSAADSKHKAALCARETLQAQRESIDFPGDEASLRQAEGALAEIRSGHHRALECKTELEKGLSSTLGEILDAERLEAQCRESRGESSVRLLALKRVARHAAADAGKTASLARIWQEPVDTATGAATADGAFLEASTRKGSLEVLLNPANDSSNLLAELGDGAFNLLREIPSHYLQGQERRRAENFFAAWDEVIRLVSQILPRDCVDTDDPVLASRQLHQRSRNLTSMLETQEKDFQTDSCAVANSIKSRIRDESRKINKINRVLDTVAFGNIAAIKIDFRTRENLMDLLEAMQNKEQWDLYSEDLSLVEAMKKVYERKTGGQIQGSELLDYRNYLSMSVKVRRKSSQKMEPASVLSTGEAIGVGAAILGVVLGAWEENSRSSFSRSKEMRNSLRFLLIDEATRLDPGSISTLLDFCSKLDIQLLIAGPKFEAAGCGRGITYALARQNFADNEQVVISGRRGFSALLKEESKEHGGETDATGIDAPLFTNP